jgi:hypothetical protein
MVGRLEERNPIVVPLHVRAPTVKYSDGTVVRTRDGNYGDRLRLAAAL